jgi:hypothetical protein
VRVRHALTHFKPVLVVSLRASLVERASAVPSEQRLALLLKAYERPGNEARYVLLPQ